MPWILLSLESFHLPLYQCHCLGSGPHHLWSIYCTSPLNCLSGYCHVFFSFSTYIFDFFPKRNQIDHVWTFFEAQGFPRAGQVTDTVDQCSSSSNSKAFFQNCSRDRLNHPLLFHCFCLDQATLHTLRLLLEELLPPAAESASQVCGRPSIQRQLNRLLALSLSDFCVSLGFASILNSLFPKLSFQVIGNFGAS